MFLKAKRTAFLGILLGFNVILIILSGVLEMNTLFLLGAASFFVGIAIREFGVFSGLTFLIASLILGFLLAPNKIYCFTYASMAMYILLTEAVYHFLVRIKVNHIRNFVFWCCRLAIFNGIFLSMIFMAPKLLGMKLPKGELLLGFILAGQVAMIIFEEGYCYFQDVIWTKYRRYLNE